MTPLQKYAEMQKQAGLPRYLKNIAKSPTERAALAGAANADVGALTRRLPAAEGLPLLERAQEFAHMDNRVSAHLSGRAMRKDPKYRYQSATFADVTHANKASSVRADRGDHYGNLSPGSAEFSARPLKNIAPSSVPPYSGGRSPGSALRHKLQGVPGRNDVDYMRTYGVAAKQRWPAAKAPRLSMPTSLA